MPGCSVRLCEPLRRSLQCSCCLDPWVDVVNPNFTTIIKDNAPFAFAGATFNARGQVSVPNVDAIGGQ